jgi:putative tricarboxylic transport membrane protein
VRRADARAAGLLLVVGLVVLLETRRLRLGSIVAPGPGFFPLLLAGAFSLVCLALLIDALRRAGPGEPVAPAAGAGGRFRVAATVVALFVYAFALEPLGFLVATSALLFFFFRAVERQRWWVAAVGSLAASVVTYVVFRHWLSVRLPAGPWGP